MEVTNEPTLLEQLMARAGDTMAKMRATPAEDKEECRRLFGYWRDLMTEIDRAVLDGELDPEELAKLTWKTWPRST